MKYKKRLASAMMTSLFLFLTNFAVFLTNFRCSLPIIRINFAAENKDIVGYSNRKYKLFIKNIIYDI